MTDKIMRLVVFFKEAHFTRFSVIIDTWGSIISYILFDVASYFLLRTCSIVVSQILYKRIFKEISLIRIIMSRRLILTLNCLFVQFDIIKVIWSYFQYLFLRTYIYTLRLNLCPNWSVCFSKQFIFLIFQILNGRFGAEVGFALLWNVIDFPVYLA